MLILGIETSCDETAAAVLEEKDGSFSVLSNVVSSQIKLHSQWGGVVPNLAAREHLKNIIPVISKSLKTAGIQPEKLDLLAVTEGPGLIPALLIGNMAAKTLSYTWKKPLIGIHHIEGHIYANFINRETRNMERRIAEGTRYAVRGTRFPLLCLVVSGGHTQLVLMKSHLHYEIVGQTLDDAAGEAFDKVARILNLGYPGGPEIAKRATVRGTRSTIRDLSLPRPMINSHDFNFSFSGLKTAVLYLVKKNQRFLKDELFVREVCREFQQAVIDVLISKTIAAARKYNPKTISLAGGVSANKELRKQLKMAVEKKLANTSYRIPGLKYSLDNAAMIAAAGYFRYEKERNKKRFKNTWKNLEANPNLELK